MLPRNTPPLQQQIWANVATGTGASAPVNLQNCPWATAFGHVSGACTITVMYSWDGVTFYASQNKQTLAGAADFAVDFTTGAPFVALQSSANVTATAYVSAR